MPDRRQVLGLIGGGTVIAAVTAGSGCNSECGVDRSARAPWGQAGKYADYRKRALSYALLAPNPHNRQPWLVRLDGADSLTLYVDLDRRLPATDPFDRQITIGCGAFLELLSIAAAAEGYRTDIAFFPRAKILRPSIDDRSPAFGSWRGRDTAILCLNRF